MREFLGNYFWGYVMNFALKRSVYDRQFIGKNSIKTNPQKSQFFRHFLVGNVRLIIINIIDNFAQSVQLMK